MDLEKLWEINADFRVDTGCQAALTGSECIYEWLRLARPRAMEDKTMEISQLTVIQVDKT